MWSEKGLGRCSLSLVGDTLVGQCEDGELIMFRADPGGLHDASTFQPTELTHPCWTAPVVVGNLMYVRGKEKLVCFRLPTRN